MLSGLKIGQCRRFCPFKNIAQNNFVQIPPSFKLVSLTMSCCIHPRSPWYSKFVCYKSGILYSACEHRLTATVWFCYVCHSVCMVCFAYQWRDWSPFFWTGHSFVRWKMLSKSQCHLIWSVLICDVIWSKVGKCELEIQAKMRSKKQRNTYKIRQHKYSQLCNRI